MPILWGGKQVRGALTPRSFCPLQAGAAMPNLVLLSTLGRESAPANAVPREEKKIRGFAFSLECVDDYYTVALLSKCLLST